MVKSNVLNISRFGEEIFNDDWDRIGQAYPTILVHGDQEFIFYSGNNFGSLGMGGGVVKTILFLGGAHHQIFAIEAAKKLKHFTICADNKPNNPGHKIADLSYDVSTTSIEEIFEIVKSNNVDLIYSYGSDIAMRSLGFANDYFNLPGPTDYHCNLFSQKDIFREFIQKTNIQKNRFLKFSQKELLNNTKVENKVVQHLNFPVIVKPTDRSGGNGISVCYRANDLKKAMNTAICVFENYNSGRILFMKVYRYGDDLLRWGSKFWGWVCTFSQKLLWSLQKFS